MRLISSAVSAAIVASLSFNAPSSAVLPPDTSGTWAITETRAGQKCTATLMLQPTRLAQSAEELNRGAARYQGVCVDSADGSWLVQEGDPSPRLAWRLEYDKSLVYFSFPVVAQDGTLGGSGDVFAHPRSDPKSIRKVGTFDAKRVSKEWSLQNPVVARRVTDKVLQ